ncbi:MAG: hypothetical protein FWG70_11580 [Oscillospiraceae bacterium]|nr:hypothetical protein [Oscillospiraceae bacterium]
MAMMNRCEAEIDTIRLKLYEETKNLTKEEQSKRLQEKIKAAADKYGFTHLLQPFVNNEKYD